MYLKNAVKHFKLITNHKWIVFKLCCKVGEPWRGFWHDISKYSPTEFGESIKYYVGTHSPITEAKKEDNTVITWPSGKKLKLVTNYHITEEDLDLFEEALRK